MLSVFYYLHPNYISNCKFLKKIYKNIKKILFISQPLSGHLIIALYASRSLTSLPEDFQKHFVPLNFYFYKHLYAFLLTLWDYIIFVFKSRKKLALTGFLTHDPAINVRDPASNHILFYGWKGINVSRWDPPPLLRVYSAREVKKSHTLRRVHIHINTLNTLLGSTCQ